MEKLNDVINEVYLLHLYLFTEWQLQKSVDWLVKENVVKARKIIFYILFIRIIKVILG